MKHGRRLLLAAAALAALDVGRRLYRQSQLFEPLREPVKSWDPADYGIPAGAAEEHWIRTSDGETLHAWYCRAPEPKASGLFCHGNKANITLSANIIPHLLRAGLSILFFDYRGFGRSSGRPTVAGVLSDAVTAARFHDTLRPPHLPSILYGFSLGGAIAAQVMRRHPFDGLVLQSTFTSLTALTRVMYPRVPLHLLAGRLFDTLRVVRKLDVPLLMLHGSEDEVAPCTMAHALHDACPSARHIHRVEGGMHNDLYERDPDGCVRALSQFIDTLRDRVQSP
jgi:alpha-beta hydrolase superfamily lysophospholipase